MFEITKIIGNYNVIVSPKEKDTIEEMLIKQINDRVEQLIKDTLHVSENITASESTLREADFKIKTDPQIELLRSELLKYETLTVLPTPIIITTA